MEELISQQYTEDYLPQNKEEAADCNNDTKGCGGCYRYRGPKFSFEQNYNKYVSYF
jgi:hypothetical protein